MWIMTDGSVKMNGLSATLYVLCDKKLLAVSSVLRPERTRSPASHVKWRLYLLLPPSSTLHLTLSSQNPRPVFSPIASPVFNPLINFATTSSLQALVSQHSCPLPAVTRTLSATLPFQPTFPQSLPVATLLSVMIHIVRSAFSFLKPKSLSFALFQPTLLAYKHSWNVQTCGMSTLILSRALVPPRS